MNMLSQAHILVVDDTPENLQLLVGILQAHDYNVHAASNGPRALVIARQTLPDVVLLDIRMPEMDGFAVCDQLKADPQTRDIPVIFISALGDIEDKVSGFEAGGVDYITKPFQTPEVLARVKIHLLLHRLQSHLEELVATRATELRQVNARLQAEIEDRRRIEQELQQAFVEIQHLQEQLQAENAYLRQEIHIAYQFGEIIGESAPLKYVLHRVEKVAATDTTVLITGETGVGKELIARALHQFSARKARPLIKVNCAALPAQLIESELFGHEKGAFTGATAKRIGRFELADGATLFLDEIGELPLELQPKLLRVLQEGELERVGSSQTIRVDVRILAATNRNLQAEVHAGRFRQDLYYRLNVYPISMPPLRERPEDIPLFVRTLVAQLAKKLGKPIDAIPQATMRTLQGYSWPGNVRELENVLERAVISTPDHVLRVDVPLEGSWSPSAEDQTLAAIERAHILRVLEKTTWKIEGPHGAARLLGLRPSTLRSRMQKLAIKRP